MISITVSLWQSKDYDFIFMSLNLLFHLFIHTTFISISQKDKHTAVYARTSTTENVKILKKKGVQRPSLGLHYCYFLHELLSVCLSFCYMEINIV